ncbi:transmembrane protein 237B isoform X3 [Ictalurus furcatus]|uniref:transmembrane protein 237B isoform X3 n=1 Tax=Ictalurus furcatus TaxID=66913 RepID=UPI002350DCB2|nr:transmembrane protein 237B isoform X3 [Ictalurus furcatus]
MKRFTAPEEESSRQFHRCRKRRYDRGVHVHCRLCQDEMPVPKKKKKKKAKPAESTEAAEVPKAPYPVCSAQLGGILQPLIRDGGIEMGGLPSPRQSASRERLTPEPPENLPQTKKKKKKAETVDQDGDQANLVLNSDMADQNSDEETTRKPKKKKTKPKVTETEQNNDLGIEDDDIITGTQPPIPQHALFSAPQGQSQPVAKVFIERERRFQPAERTVRRRTSNQMEHNFMDVQSTWTTRDVSMRVHHGFRVIGLFSHGFLAGYAVWNIIVLYVLAGDQMSALPNLLQQYYSLAYPAQCLFYFLLALSTVSAFDRVNLARAPTAIRSFLTLDPVALASFLYFSALVLSLSQQMTSDRINLYRSVNASLWLPGSEHSVLYPWIIVQLVVTLLVGLAWVLVSTTPDVDYTEESLMAMKIEYPSVEEKGGISA